MDNLNYVASYSSPKVDRREIFRYMGVISPSKELEELLDECLNEVLPRLSYKVIYHIFDIEFYGEEIDLGFTRVKSLSLSKALTGSNRIVLFAATIGIELDRLIMRYKVLSPTKALVLQAIGAERVEALCDAFCFELKERYNGVKPRFSPGYGDLSLSIERNVFSALDMKRIGITLNDSMLMSPTKSVTAIVGISDEK